jgi:hypothetical protein
MLVVAVLTPLRPTLVAVNSCTRSYANLLVLGQIVSGLVCSRDRVELTNTFAKALHAWFLIT